MNLAVYIVCFDGFSMYYGSGLMSKVDSSSESSSGPTLYVALVAP